MVAGSAVLILAAYCVIIAGQCIERLELWLEEDSDPDFVFPTFGDEEQPPKEYADSTNDDGFKASPPVGPGMDCETDSGFMGLGRINYAEEVRKLDDNRSARSNETASEEGFPARDKPPRPLNRMFKHSDAGAGIGHDAVLNPIITVDLQTVAVASQYGEDFGRGAVGVTAVGQGLGVPDCGVGVGEAKEVHSSQSPHVVVNEVRGHAEGLWGAKGRVLGGARTESRAVDSPYIGEQSGATKINDEDAAVRENGVERQDLLDVLFSQMHSMVQAPARVWGGSNFSNTPMNPPSEDAHAGDADLACLSVDLPWGGLSPSAWGSVAGKLEDNDSTHTVPQRLAHGAVGVWDQTCGDINSGTDGVLLFGADDGKPISHEGLGLVSAALPFGTDDAKSHLHEGLSLVAAALPFAMNDVAPLLIAELCVVRLASHAFRIAQSVSLWYCTFDCNGMTVCCTLVCRCAALWCAGVLHFGVV